MYVGTFLLQEIVRLSGNELSMDRDLYKHLLVIIR